MPEGASIGTVEGLLRLRDEFTQPLKRAEQQLGRTAQRSAAAGGRMSRNFDVAARSARGLGAAIGATFSAAAAAQIARSAHRMGLAWESELTKIHTLVGVNRSVVNEWSQEIRGLSRLTGESLLPLAQGMFVVSSAGERGGEAFGILEQSAKAAAIGLGDTATIARVVTAAMQAYKSSGLGAAEAVDTLVGTVREGNLEAQTLAVALGRVLGIAAELGVRFADLGAFIATYTRLGVSAEEATTGLRAALISISKVTKQQEAAARDLGIDFKEIRRTIVEEGLVQGMSQLTQAAQGNFDAFTRLIPEARAMAGILGVVGSQFEAATQIQENLRNSLGLTNQAFAEWEQTGDAAARRLSASMDALRLSISRGITPALTTASRFWTEHINRLLDAAEAGRDASSAIADTTAAVTAARRALAGIIQLAPAQREMLEEAAAKNREAALAILAQQRELREFAQRSLPARQRMMELGTQLGILNAEWGDLLRALKLVPPAAAPANIELGRLGGAARLSAEATEALKRRTQDYLEVLQQERSELAQTLALLREELRLRQAMQPLLERFPLAGSLDVPDTISADLSGALDNALEDTLAGFTREWNERFAPKAASEFSRELQAAIFSGVVQGFEDSRSAVLSIFQGIAQAIGGLIAQQVGSEIGGAMGGPIGAVVGGVAAGLLSNLAGRIFGSEPDLVQRFLGAVNIFGPASETLKAAAEELREAARALREQFMDLSRMLGGALLTGAGGGLGVPGSPGGLEGGTGGPPGAGDRGRLKRGLFDNLFPDIIVGVTQLGEQFHVSIQGMLSGVGDSIEEAVRNLMDRFAQILPQLIEQGFVTLEGIPELLANILAQGAASFDELQANLETGLRALQATLGEVGFAVFQWAADMRAHVQELARLGVDQADILTVIREGFHDFLNQLVGAELFQSLVNIREVLRDLRERFQAMGLEGQELADRMRDARRSLHLFNRQARLDVLGQLADMARQFGVAAREVRAIERARVRIQFAILRIQLESLGLWERFADLFRRVRQAALDAANNIGRAARDIATIGGTGPGSITAPTVQLVKIIEDTQQPGQSYVEFLKDQFQTLRDIGQNLSPTEQILKKTKELFEFAGVGGGPLFGDLLAAFQEAMENILEGLRQFRESLEFGPMAAGTPGEQAQDAIAQFQEAIAAILGGDITQIDNLQALASLVLQLAGGAYGTSTAAFEAIREMVLASLDAVLGAGYTLDVETGDVVVQQAVQEQSMLLQSMHTETTEQADRNTWKLETRLLAIESALRSFSLNHAV